MTALDRIHDLVRAGEADLATIEAIRAVAAWWPHDEASTAPRPALAEALNVLGCLRYGIGDLQGAVGCFRAAMRFDPAHDDARANLADAEPELAAVVVPEMPNTDADALNPWAVDVLVEAQRLVDFAGKDVVEIGGALPRATVDALGVRRWVGCDPRCDDVVDGGYEVRGADAAALPFPDESFDIVFSSCAFEHFADVPAVLAEARRVLRPGGALVTDYGPLWTHPHGHHLVEIVDGRALLFVEPIVPNWAHLVLGRRELRRFIDIGWGAAVAEGVDRRIFETDEDNHLPEAGHRAAFWSSGLEVEVLEGHGWIIEPGPAMRSELERLHPDGSDFSIYNHRVLLRKPAVLPAGWVGGDANETVSVVVPASGSGDLVAAVRSACTQTKAVAQVVVPYRDVASAQLVRSHVADERVLLVPVLGDRDPVGAGIAATTGSLVLVLEPVDRLVPTAVELLAPLLGDRTTVAAAGSWVPTSGAAPAPGAVPVRLTAEVEVFAGSAIGRVVLDGDPLVVAALRGALVRGDALRAAVAASPVGGERLLTGATVPWLDVLAQGRVVVRSEVCRFHGALPVLATHSPVAERWAALRALARHGYLDDPERELALVSGLLGEVLGSDSVGLDDVRALAEIARRIDDLVIATQQPARSLIRCFFGHHKAATTWIRDITDEIAERAGLRAGYVHDVDVVGGDLAAFVESEQLDLLRYPNADIVHVRRLGETHDLLGVHIVRDPRDTIVSGYFSHLATHPSDPTWIDPIRERLRSLDFDAGLLAEMDAAVTQMTMAHVRSWDYEMPNVLELRMEDVVASPRTYMAMAFRFLGLDALVPMDELLEIVDRHAFSTKADGREPGQEDRTSHYRKGEAGDWRNHFGAEHVEAFERRYGDLVPLLGYDPTPAGSEASSSPSST
jgi:SAM-dependent methyltransferase